MSIVHSGRKSGDIENFPQENFFHLVIFSASRTSLNSVDKSSVCSLLRRSDHKWRYSCSSPPAGGRVGGSTFFPGTQLFLEREKSIKGRDKGGSRLFYLNHIYIQVLSNFIQGSQFRCNLNFSLKVGGRWVDPAEGSCEYCTWEK